jgi:hypothetical protein
MGSESSKQGQEFVKEFQSKFSFLKEIQDKQFGNCLLYKHKVEEKYLVKRSKVCKNEAEFLQFSK